MKTGIVTSREVQTWLIKFGNHLQGRTQDFWMERPERGGGEGGANQPIIHEIFFQKLHEDKEGGCSKFAPSFCCDVQLNILNSW